MYNSPTLSHLPCERLRRAIYREKVQRALFALVLMTAWVLLGCRTFREIGCNPSDTKLRELWQENRAELEGLIATMKSDAIGDAELKLVVERIPKPDGSQEIEKVRRVSKDKYSQLLSAASVLEIDRYQGRYEFLVASCMHSRGYLYISDSTPPLPLVDNIDNLRGVDAPWQIVFSRLDDNWYLYYDFHSVP